MGLGLELATADAIVEGVIRKAKELEIIVSVAVCDAGGNPVVFKRMDGAFSASSIAARGKAVTSAAFARPSGEVEEKADRPPLRAIIATDGRMVPGRGAVPILIDGVLVGACGVSGGTAEQDELCARAGVDGALLAAGARRG
jgi:uncharacterized protein GlcG (DUF336 family)